MVFAADVVAGAAFVAIRVEDAAAGVLRVVVLVVVLTVDALGSDVFAVLVLVVVLVGVVLTVVLVVVFEVDGTTFLLSFVIPVSFAMSASLVIAFVAVAPIFAAVVASPAALASFVPPPKMPPATGIKDTTSATVSSARAGSFVSRVPASRSSSFLTSVVGRRISMASERRLSVTLSLSYPASM